MPAGKLYFDMNAIWELLLLGGAVKTGLIEALKDGFMAEEELAEKIKADSRSLWVVVEALIETGYLERDNNSLVGLTAVAADMLFNEESEIFTGFSFMHGYELCNSWTGLPETIKSGRPVRRERGKDGLKGFIKSMSRSAQKIAPQIAADCLEGLGEHPKVLDVGGGPLTFAREFASLGASVTVLDLPEVVELMKPALDGLQSIKMLPGDMTVSLPGGPFDIVYLGNVSHIFSEEENRRIFSRVYNILKSGGRIAVQDFVRGICPRAALFGVNMLVNTAEGGTWTLEQYGDWMADAGFKKVELKNYGERQLLLAGK